MKNKKQRDNQINEFIVFSVEQFASYKKLSSKESYKLLNSHGIIDDLVADYEDLHGYSFEWLNNHFSQLIKVENGNIEIKHLITNSLLIHNIIETLVSERGLSFKHARDKLYNSNLIDLIDDDETGLYGESPLYALNFLKD